MNRITSVLLIFVMLFGAVSLTGCREEYALEIGEFGYDIFCPYEGVMLGVRSQDNTFSRDNVNFDLYIGLKRVQHPINRFFTNLTADPSIEPIIEPEKVNTYYLIGMWNLTDYLNSWNYGSSVNITGDDFYILKEISYVDAIKNDTYDIYRSRFTGINYNGYENISVPRDMIDRELANDDAVYHSIVIAIVQVQKNSDGEYEDTGYRTFTVEIYILEDEDGNIILR